MKKATIRTWKDCRDFRTDEAFAREHGVEIREGKGDHKVMSYHGRSMTYYTSHDMSIGVAREVFKFFLRTGLIACFVLGMWYVL
jgi:hypothetical protein